MSDVKREFLEALNTDLPNGIGALLLNEIPSCPDAPATVEDAIIAEGQLSLYLIAILNAFVGLTPVDLLLHVGQKNATLQGILLSSLELVNAANPHDFEIFSPNPNQECPEGSTIHFGVQVNTPDPVDSVVCELTKDGEAYTTFALTYDGNNKWINDLTLEPDPYNAAITVTWVQDNYSKMQSVAFFVMEN